MRATVSTFLEASGSDGHAAALRMSAHIEQTLREIDTTFNLMRSGNHAGALKLVDAGRGNSTMDRYLLTAQGRPVGPSGA